MWKLAVLLFGLSVVRSQELKNGTACKEEILQLACGDDEVLAIHSAVFDGHDTKGCGILMPINISTLITPAIAEELEHSARRFSVQSSINRRCSGVNNCTVQLETDEPAAKQWGNGKLHVVYNCLPEKSARFKCGSVIEIETPPASVNSRDVQSDEPESDEVTNKPSWYPGPDQVAGWGYVHSAGYPQYYRGGGGSSGGHESNECRWTVRASRKRRVRLTILDLSIRSVLSGEKECKDVVTVKENARQLLNKCGDVEEPLVIESSGDELNLTLSVRSAEKAVSKRGIFAFFTATGCPEPRKPKHAYLMGGSNATHAEFICSVDHVFPDTGLRSRNITCLEGEGHRWSEELPDCIDVKHIESSGNKTLVNVLRKAINKTTDPEIGELTNYSLTYDFIVPTAIIATLIVGNLVILAAVIHCRRRSNPKEEAKESKEAKDEESVPLKDTPGPSDAAPQAAADDAADDAAPIVVSAPIATTDTPPSPHEERRVGSPV